MISKSSAEQRERRRTGKLALKLPRAGRRAGVAAVQFARAGERAPTTSRSSACRRLENRDYPIEAVATVDGTEYQRGLRAIEHRDLETRYLYRPAVAQVRGIDVTIAPGLKVGYVMGIGDEVPLGLAQLGAQVQLLGEQRARRRPICAGSTRSSPARAPMRCATI